MFLLEGLPAIVLGFVVLGYLTDSPDKAEWLAPDERRWLAERVRAEQQAAQKRHGVGIGAALVHPTVWLLGLILFACQTGSYGLTLWIPQIVQGLSGFSDFTVSMISALPYVAAAIGMIAIGTSSDRTGERFLHIAIPSAIGGLGFIASAYFTSPLPGMIALTDRGRRRSRHARPVLGAADAFPDGQRRGRRHRTHQYLRRRSAASSARRSSASCATYTGSFAGGLVFLAVLLLLAAGATLVLRRARALAD